MEPGADRVADPERAGLAGQDEEDGLEGVLGLVLVAEGGAADPPDHRPVPLDQRGEGRLGRAVIAATGEPLQERTVGQAGGRAAVEDRAEPPQDGAGRSLSHVHHPPARFPPRLRVMGARGDGVPPFSRWRGFRGVRFQSSHRLALPSAPFAKRTRPSPLKASEATGSP